MITVLDGPLGTQLGERGVATPAPLWSAAAIEIAPEVIRAIHTEYAAAGATVHTACTFRTQPRWLGERYRALARQAVALASGGIWPAHRVAGSIAPIEDCYRPDLSPPDAREGHRALARTLAELGVDVLLCEAFPHVGEAWVAVEEAVATGIETWVSFTAGPDADLLTPDEVAEGARGAVARGASAVLVNCISAASTLPFVQALATSGVPFGAYANSGHPDDGIGWIPSEEGPRLYADHAATWVAAGATIVGSCCGTGPRHIAELVRRFGGDWR